ncbi:LamG domain-containing protein [Cohnella abietis]|uniref:Laminin G domain-containing protein n=1 Tax=Cohnella abietis TaxID=2507935 RepID=A0A3T1D2N8_9BACL|nr:LamG domain-containing protein [Cohnella abietis]BBI32372.1 hypothetical protein KCTCHS21_17710 [Cohnella abietis]
MLPTSDQYKRAVVSGNRSSAAIILFGVYDVTAKDDATLTAASQPFTSINAVKGDVREPDYRAGTFEQDYLNLDGSFYLMPDNVNPAQDILGWWSQQMSNSQGTFDEVDWGLSFKQTDYVSVPYDSRQNLTSVLSLETWIKFIDQDNRVIIEKSNNNTHFQFQSLQVNQGSLGAAGRIAFMVSTQPGDWVTNGSVATTLALNDGKWHHLVGTYDKASKTAKIYVDGVLNNTNTNITNVPTSNTSPLLIGSRSGVSGFGGSLKEIRLWNKALSLSEIQYSMTNSLTGSESGLVGYWRLREKSGIYAADSSPTTNRGTLVNSPDWIQYIPTITIQFASLHSSLGIGLFFGSSDCCSEFDVTWYRGASLIGYKQVTDNTLQDSNVPIAIENYNKIVIRLIKTVKPYRYARLMEIGFGLEEAFDNNELTIASITEEIDPISSALSVNTLKFTVLNKNQRFNMLNPEGVYAFLQRRQKIIAKSGLWMPDGTYEYLPMGTYYLSDWKNATGLTATLEATDVIGLLDRTTYRSSKFWVNEPVENVLRHILDDAGQFSLIVSASAASEKVTGYIPVKSHREAISNVLTATRNTLRVGRNGIINVIKVDYDTVLDTIRNDTLISGSPSIEQKPLVTSVEAKEYSYVLSPDTTELNNSTFSVVGTQTVFIEYGKAAANVSVTVTGSGSIVGSPVYSAVSVKLTITGNGSVTVKVTGRAYTEAARTVITQLAVIPAGEVPQTATISDNKLITGNGSLVATHVLNYLQRRISQKFGYWSNPAIQAGDCVSVETMFGSNRSGVVERQEITFAPKLIATLEVTG